MRRMYFAGGFLGMVLWFPLGSVKAQPALNGPGLPVPPPAAKSQAPAAPASNPIAQTNEFPSVRTIMVGEVEARSGPSLKFYPTSKLRRGDRITVLKEIPGSPTPWLAIKPPPGSFSWINKRFIERKGQHVGLVIAPPEADVPIMPGSSLTDQTPNVEQGKLKRGTLVVLLDDTPVYTDAGAWLPIDATPEEVRYIPADAVDGSKKENPASPTTPPNGITVAQAEQAYKVGNLAYARQLYAEAARNAPTYEERVKCMQRLDELVRQGGGQPGAQTQPGFPAQTSPGQPPYQLASRTANNPPPAPGAKVSTVAPKQTASRWSGWGILKKTNSKVEGQPLFVLEDKKGTALLYAVTQSNLTLDPYQGRLICLWGYLDYRADDLTRRQFMRVSYVALP